MSRTKSFAKIYKSLLAQLMFSTARQIPASTCPVAQNRLAKQKWKGFFFFSCTCTAPKATQPDLPVRAQMCEGVALSTTQTTFKTATARERQSLCTVTTGGVWSQLIPSCSAASPGCLCSALLGAAAYQPISSCYGQHYFLKSLHTITVFLCFLPLCTKNPQIMYQEICLSSFCLVFLVAYFHLELRGTPCANRRQTVALQRARTVFHAEQTIQLFCSKSTGIYAAARWLFWELSVPFKLLFLPSLCCCPYPCLTAVLIMSRIQHSRWCQARFTSRFLKGAGRAGEMTLAQPDSWRTSAGCAPARVRATTGLIGPHALSPCFSPPSTAHELE